MSRSRGFLAVGFALLGFLLVAVFRAHPANPESRLPRRFRLAGLIQQEQATTARLRQDIDSLRDQVEQARRRAVGRRAGEMELEQSLRRERLIAGLDPLRGPGLQAVLNDSNLKSSPTGNVNDLVIHSEDVQAVVNALWRAGAEAIAINDQRLVATSAVLCVGNTLLLNGTVHSPPYRIAALGADRRQFGADGQVQRLQRVAGAFGLQFSVEEADHVSVPGYEGATALRFARP